MSQRHSNGNASSAQKEVHTDGNASSAVKTLQRYDSMDSTAVMRQLLECDESQLGTPPSFDAPLARSAPISSADLLSTLSNSQPTTTESTLTLLLLLL